ncbi:DUF2274 domain-containing protein [Sphingomonas koreensis]|uniref:DUF2274 domain-containing protein n=1 Tax=Sphingomonas koreensis TaxID=93064 RepID=A0A1L6JHD1_9SPHN|nr:MULTISPECIES: DUF2274 domain-containing protein [Sphingomonas]APR55227.1 transposase [Sphingomonas koreensis]MBA4760863.1 DUF2274 domain-containing protein [Sphingomonas sp.]MDC7810857.1 DUF2274 domain-containing protein [Sphingomonas koreensis]MDK2769569.1 DUF2274 domain-containing protein [Sphingomonas sp.]PJI89762.1 hypothetical protein BDW16_3081 [Sphingomonas koreensis]
MADLRLPRLPDRTPVKISIQVPPHLFADLTRYAALYKEAYSQEEAVADLIPSMLTAFLDSDRAFAKARSGGK